MAFGALMTPEMSFGYKKSQKHGKLTKVAKVMKIFLFLSLIIGRRIFVAKALKIFNFKYDQKLLVTFLRP